MAADLDCLFLVMNNRIRILLVENDEADVVLIRAMLRESGLDFTLHHVENEREFVNELQKQPWDIILSDQGFPAFDGFNALELARTHYPEVHFIFITGAMGEDVALASFKTGATDYVQKSRLPQLPYAVERAWHEVQKGASRRQVKQDRDQLIKDLEEALIQIKSMTGLLPACALCKPIRDHQDGSLLMEDYLQPHSDAVLPHQLCPECETKISPILAYREQVYAEFRSGG